MYRFNAARRNTTRCKVVVGATLPAVVVVVPGTAVVVVAVVVEVRGAVRRHRSAMTVGSRRSWKRWAGTIGGRVTLERGGSARRSPGGTHARPQRVVTGTPGSHDLACSDDGGARRVWSR